MVDNSKFKDGESLIAALASGDAGTTNVYLGMVKASDTDRHLAFAPGACDEGWLDLPQEIVGEAEVLRQMPCKEHTHPLVKLTIVTDPKNQLHALTHQLLTTAVRRASGSGTQPSSADAFGPPPSVTDRFLSGDDSFDMPPTTGEVPWNTPSAMIGFPGGQPASPGSAGTLGAWGCFPSTCGCAESRYDHWSRRWVCVRRNKCTRCIWPW